MSENLQSGTLEFASEEEKFFYDWLLEAEEKGLILRHSYQPKPFSLSEEVKAVKRFKKNGDPVMKHIMYPHKYQADYLLYLNQKTVDIGLAYLFDCKPITEGLLVAHRSANNVIFCVIDVKGGFKDNVNDVRFPLNQKWVFSKHGIYVNKVIPFNSSDIKNCLFTKTWTPDTYRFRALKRDSSKHKKCYCIPRSINDYLGF